MSKAPPAASILYIFCSSVIALLCCIVIFLVRLPEVSVIVAVRGVAVMFSVLAVTTKSKVPLSPEEGAIVNQSSTEVAFHSRALVK